MKRICILLVLIGLAALRANAQTVTGSGTPNQIPKFTGSSTIGDSVIFESNGLIGVGAGAMDFFHDGKLTVLDTRDVNAAGVGPSAIYAVTQCKVNNACAAVRGDVLSGFAHGVLGVQFVNDGQSGGGGVQGITFGTSGFTSGVFGDAEGTTGGGSGVLGITASPDGAGGVFVNTAGGNVLLGQVASSGSHVNVFRVDGNGTVFADGGFRPFGADFAESVAVKGDTEHYSPGDLLVIDASGERRLSLSQVPYSTLVAGIYSTRPGVVASTHRVDEALPNNEVPLAVVGIVPCKVTAENGPITPGDLLVTSSTPGHAMKGTDRGRLVGAVVGKALEPLREGTGVIQVLVTLQ
jgi:hypothetical protein